MTKTKINIKAIEQLMLMVCKKHGLTKNESLLVVKNYLEAELLGKRTHGVSKFCFESKFFAERRGQPSILIDTGPMIKIDGNKEVGPIAAEMCAKIAMQRAKKYGICLIGINNIQRYGILKTWVEMISKKRHFCIVVNTCEPAMVGFGGKKKVLGTNPIAFSIQTQEKNYIVDMATSIVAMSLIWQAQRENEQLPDNTFYDSTGNITTNPTMAKAVKHFGDIKGYSIALLIQLLSGSVFGFKMASCIKTMYDIGYVFFVIDPSKTTSIDSMLNENQKLIDELILSESVIPGSRSTNYLKPKEILLNSITLEELKKLSNSQHES